MYEFRSPLVGLDRLAKIGVDRASTLFKKLNEISTLFKEVTPFENLSSLEHFFESDDFSHFDEVNTFYGKILCCPVSKRLLRLFMRRNRTLQAMCAFHLSKLPESVFSIENLITLPRNVFLDVILSNFMVFWLPMTHIAFFSLPGAADSFKTILAFLSDLRIFEVFYDSFRDSQLFIYSWIQHSCTHAPIIDENTFFTPPSNSTPPLGKPHEISRLLVANVKDALKKCSNELLPLQRAVTVGLKVGNFLNDSSEYTYGFDAACATYKAARAFSRANPDTETTTIRWEYEAVCIMLRSMNSHNMYLQPEHRRVFHKNVPEVLRRINTLGLSAAPSIECEARLLASLPPDHQVQQQASSSSPLETTFSLDAMTTVFLVSTTSPNNWHESSFASLLDDEIPSDWPKRQPSDIDVKLSEVCEGLQPLNLATTPMKPQPDPSTASPPICTAFAHAQLAIYHYVMCNYPLAYQLTSLAVDQINAFTCSPRVVVEVLRIACRICIIQRKYDLGLRFIQSAAHLVRQHFGRHNVIYANLLLDYGCLLLNTDKTGIAADVYRLALTLIIDCLPGASVIAALALEDIAYAYYVLEYTSGEFSYPLECSEVANQLLQRLDHSSCMQAASANRVRALILEEIAIDDSDRDRTRNYLYVARDLHLISLDLCQRIFGIWNIQTAKHFGNLGRLFQSLDQNLIAERMHLKAIMIKERLLGPNDFEVALSVGHLASLYNYHMNLFEKAEALYLRSIQISLSLFGPSYSGLEYDYRGLQRVYRKLNNWERLAHYEALFDDWVRRRLEQRLQEGQFQKSNDYDEVMEVELCTTTSDEELERRKQVLAEFRNEFDATLGVSSVTTSSTSPSAPTSRGSAGGRTASPMLEGETSRSTGL